MKKVVVLITATLGIILSSCTKEYVEPVTNHDVFCNGQFHANPSSSEYISVDSCRNMFALNDNVMKF